MYTKQEASRLRQQFWTTFGQYMTPVLSAEAEKINWINYKTGEKDIYFKMQADTRQAYIAIELTQKDPGIQKLYFEHFIELRSIMENALQEKWTWQPPTQDEMGKSVAKVYTEKNSVSIFKKEDWPELISFFKPRIIALDRFWSSAKYSFESLR